VRSGFYEAVTGTDPAAPRIFLIRRPNPSARRRYIDALVGLLFDGARRHCRALLSFGLIVNS